MKPWMTRVVVAVCGLALLAASGPLVSSPVSAASTVRWGYYVPKQASSVASLRANVDDLTHVSPYYFDLNLDGTIKSTEEPETTAFIRSRNVKVVPMIQRYGRFQEALGTPAKMDAAVERVAAIAFRPEYDGIHIDFEDLTYAERPLLTEFMAKLAARVRPSGKLVTQALAAKTVDRTTGWAAGFDYPALARHNDLVVIMAYDYSWAAGPPGPVAPLDWVRQVTAFTRTHFASEQIVLGMPLYGYDWVVNKEPRPRAQSRSYTTAMEQLTRHNGTRAYDTASGSEVGRYTAGDDQREIWFESARSLRAKMEIAIENRLAGFGVWRLGHEDPGFWAVVREFGTPASPVPAVRSTGDLRYFPETRHTLRGVFLRYWQANGGLARFGYPLTEEFQEVSATDGQTYTVQYFERARFEYHPAHAGTDYEVLLGHMGRWLMERNGVSQWPPIGAASLADGWLYFPETGLPIGQGFRAYWEANGGLAQFGLPLTGEFQERNPDTGEVYTVQYFERARFEHHPEHAGTDYEILLGLLGRQTLRERGWLP